MKLTEKNFNIGGQILITLFFFAGMILNFFLLYPIIDREETERIRADIDRYCLHFYPYDGFDIKNESLRDSMTKAVPIPYGGKVIIADTTLKVLFTNVEGEYGDNIVSLVDRNFTPVAAELLDNEYHSKDKKSVLVFDKSIKTSFFSRYEPAHDLLFFLSADYTIAGSDMLKAYRFLLMFMTLGGLIVIIISYFDVRRMGKKLKNEAESRKDLEMAAKIQQAMLPDGEKHLMQIDVDARLVPARKVGGDFFCYLLREGILYFCIGDVSGKGVPASLFMGKAVTLFRSCVNLRLSPKQISSMMNDELCIHNNQNMFITAVIGSIRVFDGTVTMVNSGHEPPVIWDGKLNSEPCLMRTSANIPLGVLPSQDYVEDKMEICRNGLMFFYTDGVTEARSNRAGLMGRDSVTGLVERVKTHSPKEINDYILSEVKSFENKKEQSDDITLLTFKNIVRPKTLTIRNEIGELKKIAAYTESIFNECPLDSKNRILVRSGLDEALTNCVLYAYDSAGQDIEVSTVTESGSLVFTVTDGGRPFNPLEYRDERPDDMKIGGLGISMIKANFDEVRYLRDNQKNILTLVKKL